MKMSNLRKILFTFGLSILALSANAQSMTDEQVIRYVQQEQEKGTAGNVYYWSLCWAALRWQLLFLGLCQLQVRSEIDTGRLIIMQATGNLILTNPAVLPARRSDYQDHRKRRTEHSRKYSPRPGSQKGSRKCHVPQDGIWQEYQAGYRHWQNHKKDIEKWEISLVYILSLEHFSFSPNFLTS